MSTITITVDRTEKWVSEQRLARGENIPERIEVEIEPAELSEAARRVLLQAGFGSYKPISGLYFDATYRINPCASNVAYGRLPLLVDEESPTPAQIDAAILTAVDTLRVKREASEQAKAVRQAEQAVREQEQEQRRARLAEARGLLSNELAAAARTRAALATVANFLAAIPADAKRGTLRKLATEQTAGAIEALRAEIENACPITVLGDLDEADEEEADEEEADEE